MADEERPLNLLFITCDQLRRDAVQAMGLATLEETRTPAMDALAAEGTLFTQHITNALPCGPSRTALHRWVASLSALA
jgi:arylsulfatase A-like enzyme